MTRFPKFYDKLYDEKVLGILLGDMVTQNVTWFPENMTWFPENVTQFPENVTQFSENVTQFPEKETWIHENVTWFPENVTLFSEKCFLVFWESRLLVKKSHDYCSKW